jgi:hypothetical protein
MGDLVMFRPLSSATPQAQASRRSGGAEIVFFTGVRYERAELAPVAKTKRTPPKGGFDGAGRGKRKRRA